MLEPHIISGRSRSANIMRRPFFEGSIGGGINTAGGELGYIGEGEIQGYSNLPFPISFYGNLQWQRVPDSRDIGALTDLNTENKILGGTGYLTASPTAYDRFVLYYNDAKSESHIDFQEEFDIDPLFAIGFPVFVPDARQQSQTNRVMSGGIGWSHTIEYKNVLNVALLFNRTDNRSNNSAVLDIFGIPLALATASSKFDQETYVAALNHTVGVENLTWRYGIEGGWLDSDQSQDAFDIVAGAASISSSSRVGIGRVYVDLLHEINPDLKAEYGLFGALLSGDGTDVQHFDPRVGIAWSPASGQWLRAGFIRSSVDVSTPTLSPIGIVGLQPNQISTASEGYTNTMAFRWDAEWTPDFFTAVEFQHQDVNDPLIGIPLSAIPFTTSEGRIDRGSLNANLLLGHGFGLSSTVAYTGSKDEDPASATFGGRLPFIPEWGGQVALTWVNEANVKATLAANYVGNRVDEVGIELDDYWTLDASLTWEPFDKLFELELAAYNLLDENIEVSAGTPGWGRSFRGTLKVRF